MKVGIIVALPEEAKALSSLGSPLSCIEIAENRLLCISGVGAQRAEAAALALVKAGASALCSWGCAAALNPELLPGDLILPSDVIGSDKRVYACDKDLYDVLLPTLPESLPVYRSELVESAEMVSHVYEKQRLWDETKAVATDMESVAIARVAAQYSVPYAAIRVIADSARHVLPRAAALAIDADGLVSIPRYLWHMLIRPHEWAASIQLGYCFSQAKSTLRVLAPSVRNDSIT